MLPAQKARTSASLNLRWHGIVNPNTPYLKSLAGSSELARPAERTHYNSISYHCRCCYHEY